MEHVRSWIAERIRQDEDLSREELAQLATDIGREESLWREFVRHDPNERVYVELYRDVHLDIWLICWNDLQDTGFHDHDTSSGAVYVVDGELAEDRFEVGAGGIHEVSLARPAGSVFDFDAARIHCVRHPGGPQPAVSVHCYSPALWRMGFYSFDGEGRLSRASVTYADEMWSRPSGLADLHA